MARIKIFIALLLSLIYSTAQAVDSYNPSNGQLTIPSVTVGSTTFNNVVVTIGSIVSVDGVIVPTTPKNIIWHQTSNSITLEHDAIGFFEGYTSFDFDGDGQKSFFFPPGGEITDPRQPTDHGFLIFKVNSDNSLIMGTSPLATKYVAGLVNDDILIGNFGNSTTDSLIFIDHGREEKGLTYDQWELSYLWRMDKVNGAWEVTEFAKDLGKQFWHSSSNPIDINGDGILDFSVAALSQAINILFLSNPNTGQYDKIDLAAYLLPGTNYGSSALIHLATGHIGSICLPYTPIPPPVPFLADTGHIFSLSLDGEKVESTQDVMVRNTLTTQGMTDYDGYNLIRVLDLNNDGLEDFLGFAETRDGSLPKSKKIIAFLQDKNGQFYQANKQLGISFEYSLPDLSPDYYTDWVQNKVLAFDVNGDSLQDIIIPTELIKYTDILTKGIRGGYVQENGKFVDLKIPPEKILWNKEPSPYSYRYILPTEINSDGIVDFVLVGDTFDQPKTKDNPYGTMHHLTILKSEIQN